MRIISRRQAVSLALSSLAFVGSVTGSRASSAREIDGNVDATLREFSLRIGGARELLAKSAAVLVFPSVIKAGMGIGGEYGEGALPIENQSFRIGEADEPALIHMGNETECIPRLQEESR